MTQGLQKLVLMIAAVLLLSNCGLEQIAGTPGVQQELSHVSFEYHIRDRFAPNERQAIINAVNREPTSISHNGVLGNINLPNCERTDRSDFKVRLNGTRAAVYSC